MAMTMVENVDGRLMVALPPEMKLIEGETVAMTLHDAKLTVSKLPVYSLEQLIAEQEVIADQLEEDRAWLNAPRVGRELI